MRNVSMEFRNTMQERRDFYYTAHMDFTDGRSVDLSQNDIVVSGNGITESGDVSSFPLGCAIGKRITLAIRNNEDQFSDYDFYNAVIQIWLHFELSENTEIINLGKYTIRDPESYGSTISLTAVDDMYKADTDFTGTGFPKTVLQALLDCCQSCGLTLLNTVFANSDFEIQNAPTGITNRQFIGLCAMLAGGNAVVDEYGRVKILTYDFSVFEQQGDFDGGLLDENTPYSSGDTLDGGDFKPWDDGDTADGGTFSDSKKYHVFYKNQNLTVGTDDVIITGVQITTDGEKYLAGEAGYILEVQNQLTTENEADAVNRMGDLLIGLQFRPFSLDHICYPLAEFGDLCYVIDRKGRCYQSVITDVDFSFKGFTAIKCTADSPQRNSSKYNSNAEAKAIIASRAEAKKQVSEYDKAVQMLTSIMANSLGMFTTTEKADNGGEIVYQHNKPNLSDSNIIWKKTESAFTVSTDGGETWNAGIDANGNAVVNVLSAVGIMFDWARGGTLSLGGVEDKSGRCVVLDEKGNEIIIISNGGITFGDGTYQGVGAAHCAFDGPYSKIEIGSEFIGFCTKGIFNGKYKDPYISVFQNIGDGVFSFQLRELCKRFLINCFSGDLDNPVIKTLLDYNKDNNILYLYADYIKSQLNFSYNSEVTCKETNGSISTTSSITIKELIDGAKNGTLAKKVTDDWSDTISGYTGSVKVVTSVVNGVPFAYKTLVIEKGVIKEVLTSST